MPLVLNAAQYMHKPQVITEVARVCSSDSSTLKMKSKGLVLPSTFNLPIEETPRE